MKYLFVLFTLFMSIAAIGQQHKISTVLFQSINAQELLYQKRINRTVGGLFYEATLTEKFNIVGGFTYHNSNVTENSIGENNARYQGNGKLSELSFFVGEKTPFLYWKTDKIKPFWQTDLYFSLSSFDGVYTNEINSEDLIIKADYVKYGLIPHLGIDFMITGNIFISGMTGFRFGYFSYIQLQNNTESITSSKFEGFKWMPIDIRVGMQF